MMIILAFFLTILLEINQAGNLQRRQEERICAICMENLTQPFELCGNRHTFDRHCLQEWLQHEQHANVEIVKCPSCRFKIDKSNVNRALGSRFQSLKTYGLWITIFDRQNVMLFSVAAASFIADAIQNPLNLQLYSYMLPIIILGDLYNKAYAGSVFFFHKLMLKDFHTLFRSNQAVPEPFVSWIEFYIIYIVVQINMNMAKYGSRRSQQPENVNFEPILRGLKSDIFY